MKTGLVPFILLICLKKTVQNSYLDIRNQPKFVLRQAFNTYINSPGCGQHFSQHPDRTLQFIKVT